MEREVRTTGDGSASLYDERWHEHFHSIHGARQESMHVFINNGLLQRKDDVVRILEYGWGTGLNSFLSLKHAQSRIDYTSLEAFPLRREEWSKLNYSHSPEELALFRSLHEAGWEQWAEINDQFRLLKHLVRMENWFPPVHSQDLIYFDAFAPKTQPEMWTEEVFSRCFDALSPDGILVTYCAQGQVKRNLRAAGFIVEALPGPPGKREMTRAVKPEVFHSDELLPGR